MIDFAVEWRMRRLIYLQFCWKIVDHFDEQAGLEVFNFLSPLVTINVRLSNSENSEK